MESEDLIRTSADFFRAFAVQVAGAGMASGNNLPSGQVLRGILPLLRKNTKSTVTNIKQDLHVYQGGVALQQLFIFVFVAASIKFHRIIARETPSERKNHAFRLLYTLYAVLLLITVSIPFSSKPVIVPRSSANRTCSSEFYSALSSTQKASKAPFRTMRCINTV